MWDEKELLKLVDKSMLEGNEANAATIANAIEEIKSLEIELRKAQAHIADLEDKE